MILSNIRNRRRRKAPTQADKRIYNRVYDATIAKGYAHSTAMREARKAVAKAKRAKPGRRVTAPRKTYRSARKHTRKATTRKAQDQWQHVYETARKEGFHEGDAIRIANGVTKRRAVRVRKNPLKRAAKRSTSFGRRSDPYVIAGLRRGPGKRIKHYYFTGTKFTDHRDEAHIYATRAKAVEAAKAILDRLPESIVSLRVMKP